MGHIFVLSLFLTRHMKAYDHIVRIIEGNIQSVGASAFRDVRTVR